MVRLDNSALSKTGFDNVRIDRTLNEEVDSAYLLCLFFKYSDEFLTNNLSLCLRISNSCELGIESILCINSYEVKIVRAFRSEYSFYFVALVLS